MFGFGGTWFFLIARERECVCKGKVKVRLCIEFYLSFDPYIFFFGSECLHVRPMHGSKVHQRMQFQFHTWLPSVNKSSTICTTNYL